MRTFFGTESYIRSPIVSALYPPEAGRRAGQGKAVKCPPEAGRLYWKGWEQKSSNLYAHKLKAYNLWDESY